MNSTLLAPAGAASTGGGRLRTTHAVTFAERVGLERSVWPCMRQSPEMFQRPEPMPGGSGTQPGSPLRRGGRAR